VFDTNLLVSHLDLLKQVLEHREWQVVIPLIGRPPRSPSNAVITELDGLRVNPPPLGTAATEAITVIEESLSARLLRVITQQGNGLSNLAFRSQQLLPKQTEDGEDSVDAFIIQSVKDQVERHAGKVGTAEKACLVTGDRSMRVIAKARGVQALSVAELRKVVLRKGVIRPALPRKKGRG
jgi:predicted ribonuclease YlaK